MQAQNIANYTFSTNNNGSLDDLSTGSTSLTTGNNDSYASGVTAIGFNFTFMGVVYTHYSVSSNGQVMLHTSSGATALGSTTYYTSYTSSTALLAPMSGDNEVNGGIRFKLTGTSPNQKLVIEWVQFYAYYTPNLTNAGNMQLWLEEGSNRITYVYGEMYNASSSTTARAIYVSSGSTAGASAHIVVGNPATWVNTSTSPATNTFAANTGGATATPLIANLGSSSQGSRVYYQFTPPAVPADPTAATTSFTNVSSASMTLNWNDNSTTEYAFQVTRATDAGFTQNVVTTTVSSTSPGTTGTAYSTTVTGLAPNTTYYYKVRSVNEGASSTGLLLQQATTPPQIMTATTSSNWSSTSTWSGGIVPSINDTVTVPDGITVTIDNTSAACATLTIGQGASGAVQHLTSGTTATTLTVAGTMTIAAGATYSAGTSTNTGTKSLSIGGDLVVNGAFNADNGTNMQIGTTFTGTGNNTISGTGSTCSFYSIVVNKGTTQTGATLDVQRLITINQPAASATRLTVTNGTFKLSSASTLRPYYGSATICASTGRVWLNNSSAVLGVASINTTGSAGSPTVTGELRIDAGLFEYGGGSNTLTFSSTTGALNMSGGTLSMYGAIAFSSSTGTQFQMSGGEIYVRPQGSANLGTGTTAFSIGASTTVNWTGGRVTIVDPHSAAGGTAFTMASGGTKTVTGGTLRLGDGTSTLTGGTLSSTSGFGISATSSVGIYNLELDNRTDANQSRMVRLVGTTYVNNQIIGQANSYLFTASSTTSANLIVLGSNPLSLVSTSTIAGALPGATTPTIGALYFAGSTAQSFDGGSSLNLYTISVENAAGVTYTGSAINTVRVNLFKGTLSTGNLSIGRVDAAPIVQIGGSSTSAPGSFTSLPTYVTSFGNLGLVYSATTTDASYTMGNYNEIASASSSTLSFLSVGKTLTANRNLILDAVNTTSTTLTLTGNLLLGSNNLTVGSSGTALGTLSGSGYVVTTGSMTRWFGTAAMPTTATLSTGGFPLATSALLNRTASVYFSAATAVSAAGTITVSHSNIAGIATVSPSITDAGATINARSQSNWTFSTGNGLTLTGTASLTLTGASIFTPSIVTNLRLIRASDAIGTNAAPGGTVAIPTVSRTALSATDLANTFYFGVPSSDVGCTAIVSGNWADGSTWDRGTAPTSADIVAIPSGVTVTVAGVSGANSYSASASSITLAGTLNLNDATNSLAVGSTTTVSSGGTLTVSAGNMTVAGASTTGVGNTGTVNISGGSLTVGSAGSNNRTFSSTGTLNVSSGTLTVNGNLAILSSSTFIQSGGLIRVDGNNGGSTTGSVASGTNIVGIGISGTPHSGTLNLTGGTLWIVDPHTATSAAGGTSDGHAFSYWGNGYRSGTGHTLRLGDPSSSDAGGNTSGLQYDTWPGTGYFIAGNLIVDMGTTGTNRFVTNVYTAGAENDLTITSGEFKLANNLKVAGNITVANGATLTTAGNIVTLASWGSDLTSGTSNSNSTLAQTITNSGTIQNTSGGTATAQINNLTVVNGNTSGVTLASPLTMSGTLTLTSGRINTTAANLLTLISGATVSGTSNTSFVDGPVRKIGTAAFTFPVGKNGVGYQPIAISAPSVATDTFTAEYKRGALSAGSINSASGLVRVSSCEYWTLNRNTASSSNVNVTLFWNANSKCGSGKYVTDTSKLYVAHYNGSEWDAAGHNSVTSSADTTSGSVTWNSVSNFSPFTFGSTVGGATNPLPVTFTNVYARNEGSKNRIEWTTGEERNVQSFVVEKETPAGYTAIGSVPAAGKASTYALYDEKPTVGRNAYRVKVTDVDGSVSYSKTVTVLVKDAAGFALEAFPNPTTDVITVKGIGTTATEATILVTDLAGRVLVSQKDAAASATVNLAPLPAGIYMLQWNDGTHQQTIRVTKQ